MHRAHGLGSQASRCCSGGDALQSAGRGGLRMRYTKLSALLHREQPTGQESERDELRPVLHSCARDPQW